MHLVNIVVKQESNSSHLSDGAQGLSVGANAFHETNSVRVHTLGLLRDVVDAVGHLVAAPSQITNFLEQRNDLCIKVDVQLQDVSCGTVPADKEKTSGDLEFPPSHLLEPGLEDRSGVELLLEHTALSLELLSFSVKRPVLAQDIFDLAHVAL